MNIEDLRYIWAICQFKNITKAADCLHITPQALSQSIKKLEEMYGIRLFTRYSRGVEPTEVCASLLSDIEAALQSFDTVTRRLNEYASRGKKTIRVGVDSTPISMAALDLAYKFGQENGFVIEEVDLRSNNNKVPAQMQKGPAPDTVDLFFLKGSGEEITLPGYEKLLIQQDVFQLVGSGELFREFEDRQWSALDGKTIYLLALEEDFPDYRFICSHCKKAGAKPKFRVLNLNYMIRQLQERKDVLACIIQPVAAQVVSACSNLRFIPTDEPITGHSYLMVSKGKAGMLMPLVKTIREEAPQLFDQTGEA